MKLYIPGDGIPELPPSIFLAGPSHRKEVPPEEKWRYQATDLFAKQGFTGSLFLPEPFIVGGGYEKQIEWEMEALSKATVIMFWIPRDLKELPGFTTNIEFGEWMRSGKIVLGFPKDAPKMSYLEYKANRYNVPVTYTLEDTVKSALTLCNFTGD